MWVFIHLVQTIVHPGELRLSSVMRRWVMVWIPVALLRFLVVMVVLLPAMSMVEYFHLQAVEVGTPFLINTSFFHVMSLFSSMSTAKYNKNIVIDFPVFALVYPKINTILLYLPYSCPVLHTHCWWYLAIAKSVPNLIIARTLIMLVYTPGIWTVWNTVCAQPRWQTYYPAGIRTWYSNVTYWFSSHNRTKRAITKL